MMRTLLLALLLLFPACLEYEIVVTIVVKPDGTAARTLAIREKKDKKTWERFEPPAAPYAVEGDDDKGFTAKAELKPGTHPAGLRVRLGDVEEGAPAPPSADGTVSVEAADLLIGTLLRYEERIAIGADPGRFRAALPRWNELGLRYTIETLRIAFPEIDFKEVETKARAEFLPAFDRAVVAAHFSAQVLVTEARAQGRLDEAAAGRLLAVAAKEFAPLDVAVTLPEGPPFDDGELEAASEKAARQLLGRLFAPLEAEDRAKVIDAVLDEESLSEAGEQAMEKLFPGEQAQEKLARDAQAFFCDALGAYLAYGIVDSFDLRFRVEMPGILLRANGELSHLPAVAWRLEQGDLILAPPVLSAMSFVPREGAPGEGWDGAAIDRIAKALAEVPAGQRVALEGLVAKALEVGWPDDPAGLEGEEAAAAYEAIRDAVKAAVPPEPPPSAK